jgi:hypothetical protein
MTEITDMSPEIINFLEENEQYGDDWADAIKFLKTLPDLLEEVKRLQEKDRTWQMGYKNTAKLVTECEKECTCGASEVFADGY